MKKRHLAMLMACVLSAGVLTGCQKETKEADKAAETESVETAATEEIRETESEAPSEAAPAETEEKEPEAEAVPEDPGVPMVGVVTYEGGVEDASFNQSAWEGLQRLSGLFDCKTKFTEGGGASGFEGKLNEMISAGGDLIWGMGYECRDAVLAAAPEHPDVTFAIFDYDEENLPENVAGVVFRDEEPSFLAGYLAGTMTETGKVGFIGGVEDTIIDHFRYGFKAGVFHASKETGKEVAVEDVFADSYNDPEKGKELAKGLYDGGCDIIFHAAGETGVGVIQAAKEADRFVIGVDKDQSFLAPQNVITSVMKYVNKALVDVSMDYLIGNSVGGRTVRLGLEDDALGISENHSLYPAELYEKLLELKDQIVAGKLWAPANKEQYEVFLTL